MPRENTKEVRDANDNSHFLHDHIRTISDRVIKKEDDLGRACARALATLKARADAGEVEAQQKWESVASALPDICQASENHCADLDKVSQDFKAVDT